MVYNNQCLRTIVLFIFITPFLASCSAQLKVQPITRSENPSEVISILEKEIANERGNQTNLISPAWFAKAEESLQEAKRELAKGEKPTTILEVVALGRAQLKKANERAKIGRTELERVLQSRDRARSAGATEFEKDYAAVEEEFCDLTRKFEKGDLGYMKKHEPKIYDTFRQLELRAIKIHTLGEVRKLLAEVKKQDVHKIAPQTYADAQKRLNEADLFISENPYDKNEMLQKANMALFMARRTLEVARQSEKVKNMEPEQITLMFEKILYDIANKLCAPDMRDQDFNTQVDNILGTIASLNDNRSFSLEKEKKQQAELDTLKLRIAKLKGQTEADRLAKENLLAEKRFNELLNQAQSFYSPDEADVYKKGNILVIRLKGITFPVGKSIILPQNYALLSKVRRTIRTLDAIDVDIVVEGHTDSTGSAQLNELLSQQRAESVRQYLVSTEILPSEKISAVGYGAERPIAPNNTAAGRALNRRIDLIMTLNSM